MPGTGIKIRETLWFTSDSLYCKGPLRAQVFLKVLLCLKF